MAGGSPPGARTAGSVPLYLGVVAKTVDVAPNGIEIGVIRFSGWQLYRIGPLPGGCTGQAAYLVRVDYEFDVPAHVAPPAWAEIEFEFDAAEVLVVDAVPRAGTAVEPAHSDEPTRQLTFGRSRRVADASGTEVALPAVRPRVDCFGLGSSRVQWRHAGRVPAGTRTAWLVLLTPPDRAELPVLACGSYHVTAGGRLGLHATGRSDAFSVRLPEAPEPNAPDGGLPAAARAPRVFVSYAHDSPAHKRAVLRLCRLLAEEGVDVRVDRYGLERRRNWDRWTTTQILRTDYVIVVASPAYRAVGNGELIDETRHRGIRSEYGRLADLLLRYPAQWTRKLLPVVLPGRSPDEIPLTFLPGSSDHYLLSAFTADAAAELLRVLFTGPAGPEPRTAPVA
ncbi:toll/interleukin-1 receptor domain-containing protein [Amycolatopsis sp. NPDC005003]